MSGMYPGDQYFGPRTKNPNLTDQMRGLLDSIASTESNQKRADGGYGQAYHTNTTFKVSDPSTYQSSGPIDSGPYAPQNNHGKITPSSAKGRYQFVNKTLAQNAPVDPATGFPSLKEPDQDAAAAQLATTTYNRITGRDLATDLQDPTQFDRIGSVLGASKQWTSLPSGIEQSPEYNAAGAWSNKMKDRISNYTDRTIAATAPPATLSANSMSADAPDHFIARQADIDARNAPQPSFFTKVGSAIEAPFGAIGEGFKHLFTANPNQAPTPPQNVPAPAPAPFTSTLPTTSFEHPSPFNSLPGPPPSLTPDAPGVIGPGSQPSPNNVMPSRPFSMPARPFSQTPIAGPAPLQAPAAGIGALGLGGAPSMPSLPAAQRNPMGIGGLTSQAANQAPMQISQAPMSMPARPLSPTPAAPATPATPIMGTYDNGVSPLDNVAPATGFGGSPVGNRPQDHTVPPGTPSPTSLAGQLPSNPYANLQSGYDATHPQPAAPTTLGDHIQQAQQPISTMQPARPYSPTPQAAPAPAQPQQPTPSLSAIGSTLMSGNRALAGAVSPLFSGVGSLPGLQAPAVTPGAQVGTTGMPAGPEMSPAISSTPRPTTMQQAKTIAGGVGKFGKGMLGGAKVGSIVGGPIGGLVGAGLGGGAVLANMAMNHFGTNMNNLFGGPQPNPGSQPATMSSLAPGSARSLLGQVNRMDYGPAPQGQHYAYSPFGNNVSVQPNSQSDFSQVAGTGPGILGAFGFGTSNDGYNNGAAAAAQNAATNTAKATQSKTDTKNNQSQSQSSSGSKTSSSSSGSSGKTGGGMNGSDNKNKQNP